VSRRAVNCVTLIQSRCPVWEPRLINSPRQLQLGYVGVVLLDHVHKPWRQLCEARIPTPQEEEHVMLKDQVNRRLEQLEKGGF